MCHHRVTRFHMNLKRLLKDKNVLPNTMADTHLYVMFYQTPRGIPTCMFYQTPWGIPPVCNVLPNTTGDTTCM